MNSLNQSIQVVSTSDSKADRLRSGATSRWFSVWVIFFISTFASAFSLRASCTYSLSSTSIPSGAGGASVSISVSASSSTCAWTATSGATWLHTSSSGTGNGTAIFTIDNNTSSSARTGTLTIAGLTVTVNQAGHVAPVANPGANQTGSVGTTLTFNGSGSVAKDGATITSYKWSFGDSSSGTGATVPHAYASAGTYIVTLTVTDSWGATGQGSCTVTITTGGTASPCSFVLSSTSVSSGAGGATCSLTVTASSSTCSWTAASGASWLHTSSSGTGSGTATYTIDNNTSSAARSGTLTIAGQTFTVYQSGHVAPVANAGPNQSGNIGTTLSFNGSGSIAKDGATITSYKWAFGDLGTASGVTVTHAYASAGTYVVTLTVTDSWGATGQGSCTVTIGGGSVVAAGQIQWLQTNLPTYIAEVNGVVSDHSGNVIAVGYFYNSVNFGSGVITGAGYYDGFIAKYASNGALQWVKTFGNTGYDSANAVAIDSQNNIIVAGTFQTSVNLGAGIMTANGGTANQDAFVAKYSSSGTCIWSRNWGSGASDTAMGVAVDGSDNVIATSSSGGVVNFGNGISLTGHGGTDVALVKFQGVTAGTTLAGTTLWAQLYGGSYNDTPYGLAVDKSGNVLVTGSFGGSGNLGGTPLAGGQTSGIFIAKYSGATGAYSWSRILGGTAGYGIAADPVTANVFVTGGFNGSVNFGGGLITTPWGGTGGLFLAAYDPSGNYQWAKAWGGSGDTGYAITVDSNSNLALTGLANGTVDFSGSGVPMSGTGYVLANFTTSGSFRWAVRGNDSQSWGYAVSFDPLGHVLTGGSFYSTASFGGLSAAAASGDYNLFVAQYVK